MGSTGKLSSFQWMLNPSNIFQKEILYRVTFHLQPTKFTKKKKKIPVIFGPLKLVWETWEKLHFSGDFSFNENFLKIKY